MKNISQWIYGNSPIALQNILVTLYNYRLNYRRYSGVYEERKRYFIKWQFKSKNNLITEQETRLTNFLKYVHNSSKFYQNFIPKQDKYSVEDLRKLPIMTKDNLIEEFDKRRTLALSDGLISYTGGTTGASLKVIYDWENVQERRAFLEFFWECHGYKKGSRIAWFSGKHLIPDVKSKILWRNDWVNNIRYYSTFHINDKNIGYYIDNLNKFNPHFLVGFPSSVFQISKLALDHGYKYEGQVNCFFPTAETLLERDVNTIRKYFACNVRDQYASSEGAPFITQCSEGNLHYEMLTGIIEVVDDNLQPSNEGEILVTSFTSKGTPLIRYRIGDRIKLASNDLICPCGQHTPIVEKIHGRPNDYILSPDHGKVNLGNISNCTKGVKGIIQFQVIQEDINKVTVLLKPSNDLNETQEKLFLNNIKKAVGPSMAINMMKVSNIPQESSGKYRLVINKLIN